MPLKKKQSTSNIIALNKKARHDYHLEQTFEAGVVLQGWEVKSLRQGKVHITDSYVLIKDGEAWLLGVHIDPLPTASTHRVVDPTRTRKLLLHGKELAKLLGATERQGYTCICTQLYWKKHLVKATIAIAKGKQTHDKRHTLKERDWQRQQQRLLRRDQR